MTKLKNNLPHMAGQSVKVNGETYQIDASGIAEISDAAAVVKLLQNKSAWSLVAAEKKAKPKESITPPPPKKVVRKPIQKEEKEEEKEKTAWPEPSVSMSLSYLRQMAVAMGIMHASKAPKGELVKLIQQKRGEK